MKPLRGSESPAYGNPYPLMQPDLQATAPHCPICDRNIAPQTIDQMCDRFFRQSHSNTLDNLHKW